jgi:ribosome-binding factor A
MPREFNRSDRVAQLVKRGVAGLLSTEIDDPRVRMVTITDVEVSRDMRHANIFVTSVETATGDQQKSMMLALDKASGYLRHLLAGRLDLRRCPELHFEYDYSVQRGADLTALIESVTTEDPGGEQAGS